MQLVLGRKQIHKWDLNELKPTSQEKKKRGTGKGHGGGRKISKILHVSTPIPVKKSKPWRKHDMWG